MNTSIESPIDLNIYHRINETSLAEKLFNKLRDELYIPISSVKFPDSFSIPEVKLTLRIYDNGDVELIDKN